MRVFSHIKDLKKRIHYNIITDIIKYGQMLPKKYGNWCKLQLNQQRFLSLDTWNYSILICHGSGKYNHYTGFSKTNLESVGGDFGGYVAHYTLDEYFELRDEVDKVVFMREKWGGFKR